MRVLMIVHGFPPWALGGTEIYTHGLARALADRRGDEVFVLTREADPSRPEYHVRSETRDGLRLTIVNNTFNDCASFEESYRNPAIRRIGARLFDEVAPDVAHVHHLTCLSSELTAELAERGIPTVFTLHDYWMLCHRGQLLDLDGRICRGPDPDGCGRCLGELGTSAPAAGAAARALRRAERIAPPVFQGMLRWVRAAGGQVAKAVGDSTDASAARARHMRSSLASVDHFLAPSHELRQRFIAFGVPEERIAWAAQGIAQKGFEGLERTTGDRLRIGYFGTLMISKAPHVLLEAHAALPAGSASVDVYGAHSAYHGDDSYRARLEPLLAQPGVRYHGPISQDAVPAALASLDVVVVPSIWLENCPLVIREAFVAGVPVVASNLGGMAEMVAHERSGLLFEAGNADDLRRALARLITEPGLLDRLRAGRPRIATIEEDADAAHALYEQMTTRRGERHGMRAAHAAKGRVARESSNNAREGRSDLSLAAKERG